MEPESGPGSGPGSSTPPIAPGTPPEDAIRQICAQLAQKPAAAWVGMLDFVNLQGSTATFAPKRGMREVLNFARGPMGGRLAASISQALGQKIQLAFLDQAIDSSNIAAQANTAAKPTDPDQPNPVTASGASAHATARSLPLVRKALETFPDAVMIDARQLPPGTMPPPSTPPEETTEKPNDN